MTPILPGKKMHLFTRWVCAVGAAFVALLALAIGHVFSAAILGTAIVLLLLPEPFLKSRMKLNLSPNARLYLGSAIIVLGGLAFVSPVSHPRAAAPSIIDEPEKPSASRDGSMHIVRTAYGCMTKDYMEKLSSYRVENDREAFNKTLSVAMISGECVFFHQGDAVFVVGGGIFSGGLIQVRKRGDTEQYWVQMEAAKF